MTPSVPDHINPIQWQQAVAVSRQECARIFKDGGSAQDALTAFRLEAAGSISWQRAVDLIAAEICSHPMRRAA
ncbi:hypothetical protein DLM45_08430 [Hyphomicrobium methylovorum]|uniref:hypothetical protein n=1 Tax=Hyphomicrobium methylovorum TaxID=84 RepID=UPI0015E79447|nr:hypothetical protein [Hyphomicrobium methylovorum]MBA2126248.1 hypothetical protein [Hyphomicrobium methylovorum]